MKVNQHEKEDLCTSGYDEVSYWMVGHLIKSNLLSGYLPSRLLELSLETRNCPIKINARQAEVDCPPTIGTIRSVANMFFFFEKVW